MAGYGTPMWQDVEAVEEAIEDYFRSLWKTRQMRAKGADGKMVEWEEEYQLPPTMAGLALALGVNRTTLLHYGKGKGTRDNRFIPVLERAKSRVAEFAETALYTREGSSGAQFALRVNHDYGADDDSGETGDGFQMNVIPPASGALIEAIPKWEPEGEEDEEP